jgi:putative zinc finger/helix-turn-helix YgiT family protein
MSGQIKCDVCGKGRFRSRILDRYEAGPLVGLERVTLVHVPAHVCTACGAVIVDGAVLERAMQELTVVLIESDGALLPAEVRFLRNALDLTQELLAERLGVHRTTVARWEIGEVRIGQAESMALRALAAMRLFAEKPTLAREVARNFAKPGTARSAPPHEIAL